MKRLLLLAALVLFPTIANAQCSGQPASGYICGNPTADKGLPTWATQSALLDRNFGGPSLQGSVLNRGVSVWESTRTPVLGVPGVATGSLGLAGVTSGTVTVKAANSTANWTLSLPPDAGSNGYVLITDGNGNTSWVNNDGGGTVQSVGLALPSIFNVTGSPVTVTGTLTGTLANQNPNLVWAGPTTGSPAAPTFRSLVGADLPNPSATTLGGIRSYTAVASQWINAISTSGIPQSTQPAFSDISGVITPTQCPTPTVSSIGCIRSFDAVPNRWINTISTSGIPSASQPSFSDISGNATLSQLPNIATNTIIANNSGTTTTPSAISPSAVLDMLGVTQGNILYRSASGWQVLAPGTAGQQLISGGPSANPSWSNQNYPDVSVYTTAVINATSSDQVIAINRTSPATTVVNLPPVSGRNLAPLKIVDWSDPLTTNVITVNPNGSDTIFRLPSWTIYSTDSSRAMVTFYPSTVLNGWYVQ